MNVNCFGHTLLPSHRYHVQYYKRENLKEKQSKSLESTVFFFKNGRSDHDATHWFFLFFDYDLEMLSQQVTCYIQRLYC